LSSFLPQAIDLVPDGAASSLEVPPGIPIVYRFALTDGKLAPVACAGATSAIDCAEVCEDIYINPYTYIHI